MIKTIKQVLNYLFNAWAVFWLLAIYLVLHPFIWICTRKKSWNRYGTRLTNLWADLFFPIAGMPVSIEHRFVPDPEKNYVFVANHFSYMDVAVGMKVVRNYFSYMGKSSVKRIPLLGYMFAKLHIQVDRSDKNSRSKALLRSKKALEEGRSLFIMPEGGIISPDIPKMQQPFKDGAFILAIDAKVPIVPITFLNLYEIMPDIKLKWGIPKVIVHQPIETHDLNSGDIELLKQKVYEVIQPELDQYYSGK